ncbi:MAG TPA: hypothetical protein VGW36_03685, partial [Pyrinomonadaceae bacterium]|nr:hypothetical protein [Pyrinomonadaceae bacterium]
PGPPIRLEIANLLITLKEFRQIAAATSVSVKYGAVLYELDSDNLNALRYLAKEVEKAPAP